MQYQKQVGLKLTIADLPGGGAIALAGADTIEMCSHLTVTQTTAAQVVTLPNPADTTGVISVDVLNDGTVPFTMYGVTVSEDAFARFAWDGAQWMPDAAPTQTAEIREALTPTALNTVPDLANPTVPGTLVKIYVNSAFEETGGIAVTQATGAVTVTPATLGYNIAVTDAVTVIYTPLV